MMSIGVIQAIIAGGFLTVGWFVTFFIQEYRRARVRAEQRAELQSALRAEITDFFVRFTVEEWEMFSTSVSDRIIAGGDGEAKYRFFVPEQRNMHVFDALLGRVTQLDAGTTDPVIWYYSQMADVEAFAIDLRSDAFNELPSTRRAQAYRHYIQLNIEARNRARIAISCLNEALGEDGEDLQSARIQRRAERAAELREWINKRAGGQNDL